jgi:hypothetical protein
VDLPSTFVESVFFKTKSEHDPALAFRFTLSSPLLFWCGVRTPLVRTLLACPHSRSHSLSYRAEFVQRKWRRPRTAAEVALLEHLLCPQPPSVGPDGTKSNDADDDALPVHDRRRRSPHGGYTGAKARSFGSTVFGGQAVPPLSFEGIEVEMSSRLNSVDPKSAVDSSRKALAVRETAAQAVLMRHLLKADDVELLDRVGAGAFGEVGRWRSHDGNICNSRLPPESLKGITNFFFVRWADGWLCVLRCFAGSALGSPWRSKPCSM